MDKIILCEVKDQLRITWDEQDKQIWRLVEAAMSDINSLFGKRFNYREPGRIKTLMIMHVFYNWNNALNEFFTNYHLQIAEVMNRISIGEYADVPALGGAK